jgi:hypothetical protein
MRFIVPIIVTYLAYRTQWNEDTAWAAGIGLAAGIWIALELTRRR